MTTRGWVYLALLTFVIAGSVIDLVVRSLGPPSSATVNDILGVIGVVAFVWWWEVADATELGKKQSAPARLATVFLTPVGHAIHLFKTRSPARAIGVWLLFWAGFMIAAMLPYFVADLVNPIQLSR